MNTETKISFDNCVFADNNPSKEGAILFNSNRNKNQITIIISNCIFDKEINNLNELHTTKCTVSNNPKTIELAHFITENICVENVFVCQNDALLDEQDCEENAFSFKDDDEAYTQKFQHYIDTPKPTPTGYFSILSF